MATKRAVPKGSSLHRLCVSGGIKPIHLAIWLALLPPNVYAQTAWTGSVSPDATDAANWTNGIPSGASTSINVDAPNPTTWDLGSSGSIFLGVGDLSIGRGGGNVGDASFVFPTAVQPSGPVSLGIFADSVSIGVDGGKGTLSFFNTPSDSTVGGTLPTQFGTSVFSLGTSTGTGTLNVLGHGKNTATLGFSAAGGLDIGQGTNATATPVVGDRGTGSINVVGGGLGLDLTGTPTNSQFVFGRGSGGVANVNVLAGGKFSMGLYPSGSPMTPVFGMDGGHGLLNVDSSPAAANTTGARSTATFANGLTLGSGLGGVGSMNVLAGGKVLTFPTDSPSAVVHPVQLGVDGGIGAALVSGAGSVWDVAGPANVFSSTLGPPGELHVGVSGIGSLTIADGGTVSIGQVAIGSPQSGGSWLQEFVDGTGTLYLADNTGAVGTLNIGAPPGSAPVGSGSLRATSIIIGSGTGSINFNHVDTNYQFSVPVTGNGTIANYAGTSWLAVASPNFSGSTNLYGGTLGLSTDLSAGTSIISGKANATLAYGSGVNIANSIEIDPGVTLSLQSDATAAQAGVIRGAGGVAKTGAGTLAFTGINSYTGVTTLSAGTLSISGSGSISQSAELRNQATFDIVQASSPVSVMTLSGTGNTVLGSNELVLTNSGSNGAGSGFYSGIISGAGTLRQLAGTETLVGASTYSGGTALDGGTLVVGNDQALGTGILAMSAGTTLDFIGSYSLQNPIKLSGNPTINVSAGLTEHLDGMITDSAGPNELNKTGLGTLVLAAQNSYSGLTNVNSGVVRAESGGAFSPASAFNIKSGATLDLNGFNQTVTTLTNSGVVNMGIRPATVLTTTGDYIGGSGIIQMNTVLADSSSATDLMHVMGNTSGSTTLLIANAGGEGAMTTGNGIKVVQVDGTSRGSFATARRIEAGAYEYFLYKGGLNGDTSDGNWYLRNHFEDPTVDPVLPQPQGPVAYRPGIPGYLIMPTLNLELGFSMLGSLHQRVGDVPGAVLPDSSSRDGVWGRIGGGNLNANVLGRFSTESRTFLAQFGKNWTLDQPASGGSTQAGMTFTVGTLSADFEDADRAVSRLAVKTGNADSTAVSLGGYWTRYLADGTYFDSVGQITHYRNRYKDLDGYQPTQNGASVALSQEIGRPFQIANGPIAIEPQAQLMYQYLSLGGFHDDVSSISGTDTNALRGRVGVRIFYKDQQAVGHKNTAIPWIRANLIHDFLPVQAVKVESTTLRPDPARTWYEVEVGITATIGERGSLYSNVGYAHGIGGEARRSVQGQVGYRYRW